MAAFPLRRLSLRTGALFERAVQRVQRVRLGSDGIGRDASASFDIVALNPFRFSSEYYDSELDLVYYNYRHYSPSLGRFLSRDPIEEQGGRGGLRFGAQFVKMCANDEVFH